MLGKIDMLDGESWEFASDTWIDKTREDPPWWKRHQVTRRLEMNLSMILNRQHATVSVINNVAAGAVSTDVQGGMACRHAPYISLLPRRLLRNSATVYLDRDVFTSFWNLNL
jgi:hypothetical protein